jgi:hypothetical protein
MSDERTSAPVAEPYGLVGISIPVALKNPTEGVRTIGSLCPASDRLPRFVRDIFDTWKS